MNRLIQPKVDNRSLDHPLTIIYYRVVKRWNRITQKFQSLKPKRKWRWISIQNSSFVPLQLALTVSNNTLNQLWLLAASLKTMAFLRNHVTQKSMWMRTQTATLTHQNLFVSQHHHDKHHRRWHSKARARQNWINCWATSDMRGKTLYLYLFRLFCTDFKPGLSKWTNKLLKRKIDREWPIGTFLNYWISV